MKNDDKIRKMTDEELQQFLCQINTCESCPFAAVDAAKIQKLCNDIADAVSDIDKISVSQNVYYNCNFIMDKLKKIEKELIGMGSKGSEANGCWISCTECANTACPNRDETEAKQE